MPGPIPKGICFVSDGQELAAVQNLAILAAGCLGATVPAVTTKSRDVQKCMFFFMFFFLVSNMFLGSFSTLFGSEMGGFLV